MLDLCPSNFTTIENDRITNNRITSNATIVDTQPVMTNRGARCDTIQEPAISVQVNVALRNKESKPRIKQPILRQSTIHQKFNYTTSKEENNYMDYLKKMKEIKRANKLNIETQPEANYGLIKTKKTETNADAFVGALNYTTMNEYRLGKMLGQGAYAMVREALHIQTGHTVAIKIYDKYKLN